MDEAKDAVRLATRYPSIPSLREGSEKPAAARAESPPAKAPALSRAEEVRLKANVRAPEPTNDAEVAAARLAKRYPSLKTTAEDPNPESAGVTIDPALRARYPSIGEAGEKSSAELALEAPEGFDAADPLFVEFKKAAGEIGLDQGKASRMLELHRKVLAAQEQARDEEAKGWRAEVEQDADVMDNVETTRWLVREYGGKEFTEALGPLGDHPAIVRALTRIAKDLDAARRRGTYR